MKKKVTFVEQIEGRDTITHNGVTFSPNQAVVLDPSVTEMSPWFIGNRSFIVEDYDEATETANRSENGSSDAGADRAGEGASEVVEETTVTKPKRVRKKVAAK